MSFSSSCHIELTARLAIIGNVCGVPAGFVIPALVFLSGRKNDGSLIFGIRCADIRSDPDTSHIPQAGVLLITVSVGRIELNPTQWLQNATLRLASSGVIDHLSPSAA